MFKNTAKLLIRSENGFTLIELLISIAILALLFSFGVARYRDFQRRQYFQSAVRMLIGDLRYIRELALAGKIPQPAGNCSGHPLEGYRFRRLGNNRYQITAVCEAFSAPIKEVDLPQGIRFGNTFNFVFNTLGRGLTPASEVIIVVRYENSGLPDARIRITTAGDVQEI